MSKPEDPALWERPYGQVTAAEQARIDNAMCVLPCNSAVCPIYGSKEMILSEGALLRPDGRRAFCNGCSVDRVVPCARMKCDTQCHLCHSAFRGQKKGARVKRTIGEDRVDDVPAACGQKHAFPEFAMEELGGLETESCDIPWVPPKRLPHDRFVVGIQRNKAWIEEASKIPHRSWVSSIKGL